jgi:PQQ-like domain
MKNFVLCFWALLLCTAFCCKKEPALPTIPPKPIAKDSIMQLLWAIPSVGCYQPIAMGNQVAFAEKSGDLDFLIFRDSSNGSTLWQWGTDVPAMRNAVFFPNRSRLVGNYFCLGDENEVAIIDVSNRITKWSTTTEPLGDGDVSHAVQGEYYYNTHHTGSWAASIVRTHIGSPNWDTLHTIVDGTWKTASIKTQRVYENADGDSILIFVEGAFNWGISRARTTMTALNIKSKKVVWRNLDFEPDMNCNVNFMEIVNGKVYKLGSSTVWCFDAETGTLIWKKDFDPQKQGFEHFMGLNYACIHKDWILAKGADKHMEALDLNTGKVIWQTDEGLSSHFSLYVYKDKYIIYAQHGGGGIAVHRLDNGRLIYKNNKIAWGAISGGDLAIDHAADRIYWTDGKYAYCFRLNLP